MCTLLVSSTGPQGSSFAEEHVSFRKSFMTVYATASHFAPNRDVHPILHRSIGSLLLASAWEHNLGFRFWWDCDTAISGRCCARATVFEQIAYRKQKHEGASASAALVHLYNFQFYSSGAECPLGSWIRASRLILSWTKGSHISQLR